MRLSNGKNGRLENDLQVTDAAASLIGHFACRLNPY